MPRQSVVPGFRFDGRRKRAHFEVTLPGTNGRVRRRKTIEASNRMEALTLFLQFRDAVLGGASPALLGVRAAAPFSDSPF